MAQSSRFAALRNEIDEYLGIQDAVRKANEKQLSVVTSAVSG